MIDLMVTVITLLVVGVVALWSFSPRFRAHIEAPKHQALGQSHAFERIYPSVATNPQSGDPRIDHGRRPDGDRRAGATEA